MLFKKKSTFGEDDIRLEVPVPDFIPYACHYDNNTLLTKNGELLQIIKITGFSYETIGAVKVGLRETLRRSILENIEADNIAIWLHTVRRRANLDPGGSYDNNFASFLNRSWRSRHQWDQKYVNELHISIIHEGKSGSVKDPKSLMRSLYSNSEYKNHNQYLEKAAERLEYYTTEVLKTLQNFGAKRLSVYQRNGVSYSAQLEFLTKIINLEDKPIKMPISDLSEYMATHKVAFGNHAFEVKGEDRKHFGTVITVKEYHELTADAIDLFLQLPMRFVVTQSIDFVHSAEALEHFKKQHYILQVSGDEELGEMTGLNDILASDMGSPVDYGKHQITIVIIADDLKTLDRDVKNAVYELSKLGIVGAREDLRMEQCFWSQLPANFPFLCRQSYINTARFGGFASLHNFPAGKRYDNHWGGAVTVFNTQAGTPYFFNFHFEDNGHTMILGPFGAGKTVLMNFLVSEARKFQARLFFFDQYKASRVFMTAIGGKHRMVEPLQQSELPLNPLRSLADTKENRQFLDKWFFYLMTYQGVALAPQDLEQIARLVDSLFALPQNERSLERAAAILQENGAAHLAEKLSVWYGSGKYATLFNHPTDAFDEDVRAQAFGMSSVIENPETLGPVFSYLLYRVEAALDGMPTMVVLDEAWNLLDNALFSPDLENLLDRLRAKNAIVVFATESLKQASESRITRAVVERVATQIYLPNPEADATYQSVFGLNDKEFDLLVSMQENERQFLLKHGLDAIVAGIDLTGMEELSVLAGGEQKVRIMEEAITEAGSEPDAWLPIFYSKV